MSGFYGNETDRINQAIEENKNYNIENIGSLLSEEQTTNLANWKEKADEYAHKYSALAEGGGAEIAGALGIEGGYKAVKKMKTLYDGVQARGKAVREAQQVREGRGELSNLNNDPDGFPTADEAREETSSVRQSLSDRFGSQADKTDIDNLTKAEDAPQTSEFSDFVARQVAEGKITSGDLGQAFRARLPENTEPVVADDITQPDASGISAVDRTEDRLVRIGADDEKVSGGSAGEGVRDQLTDAQKNPEGQPFDDSLKVSPPEEEVEQPAEARFSTQYSDAISNEDMLGRTVSAGQRDPEMMIRTNGVPVEAFSKPDDSLSGAEFTTPEGGGSLSSKVVLSKDPEQNPFARPIGGEARNTGGELTDFSGAGNIGDAGAQDVRPPPAQPPRSGEIPDIPDPPDLGDVVATARNVASDAGQAVRTGVQTAQEGASYASQLGQKAFTSLAQRGQSIKAGFQNVKDFISKTPSEIQDAGQTLAETTGKTVAKGAVEAGVDTGVETGLATSDAILGAVPVLGEVALGITGLVSVGEGLYHLFHHKDKAPSAPGLPSTGLPTSDPTAGLTQKFASALPSIDSSAEVSASSMSF